MSKPVKQLISNVITAASIALLLLIIVIVTVQNRDLSEEVKRQTDINQRFLRCLILIPQDTIRTPEQRVEAVDRCVTESRLPDGTAATPPKDNTKESIAVPHQETRVSSKSGASRGSPPDFNTGSEPSAAPQSTAPQNAPTQPTEPPQTTSPPNPLGSLLQIVVQPVSDVVNALGDL